MGKHVYNEKINTKLPGTKMESRLGGWRAVMSDRKAQGGPIQRLAIVVLKEDSSQGFGTSSPKC